MNTLLFFFGDIFVMKKVYTRYLQMVVQDRP